MPPLRKPYIPEGLSEVIDFVGSMMLGSPTFIDKTGYFPERNIDSEFHALNEGLRLLRGELGDALYLKLEQWTGCGRI